MKKWYIGFMVAVLIGSFSVTALAGPGRGPGPGPGHRYDGPGRYDKGPGGPGDRRVRDDARFVIHRTAQVIDDAQAAARRGHRPMGLAQAVAHQRWARDLYWKGAYRDAIYHSLRARNIAFQVLENNRGWVRREYRRDNMEEVYFRSSPRDKDLDLSLGMIKVGRDDEFISIRLNLDLD
ncbi:hypothetical protein EDC14_101949 [Hydrogenispora ethanolica]|jgi:hypothetical protein|uniref:Uncharacterized protein n=1 Tax=Hydrogenispora ethanolica TaxID=1082276 RepID=A0A4R1REC1_HYDET|nr:hypothetical protein [Hydrogenispora ethanolica]TCL64243.1 hypothetical protein EDC14_101949 [Hydrogenispora ethanolica]